MRAAIVGVFMLASVPAPLLAQVYKCEDGGRVVFSDRPCAVDAEPVDASPASGAYRRSEAAARRAEAEAAMRRFEREDSARAEARAARAQQADRERAALRKRCEELRSQRDHARYWEGEYQYPGNIARERQKAEDAQRALWWECREVW